jgi:hypothetical protein
VSWGHQRSGCDLISVAHEKCGHGHCSGWRSPQFWHATFKILDKKTWGGLYKWTSHMPSFLYLGVSIEYFTGKLSWPTSLVMKQTPPTILFLLLTLIWDLAYCSSLMLLKTLLKSKRSPYILVKPLLQLPLFRRCSLMDPLLRKVLVLEWSLFHLVKRLYLCPTS